MIDDEEIGEILDDLVYCEELLGSPQKIPDILPPDCEFGEDCDGASQLAFSHTLALLRGISIPIIASTTYDRDIQQWVVRLEGMNDKRVYVKSYRRDDGKKDYQYREDAPLENKY